MNQINMGGDSPADDSQRPSTGPDGEQLAPEKFLRWVGPAAWEDTDGALHLDVPLLLRWLDLPDTPENRSAETDIVAHELNELSKADSQFNPEVVVRP